MAGQQFGTMESLQLIAMVFNHLGKKIHGSSSQRSSKPASRLSVRSVFCSGKRSQQSRRAWRLPTVRSTQWLDRVWVLAGKDVKAELIQEVELSSILFAFGAIQVGCEVVVTVEERKANLATGHDTSGILV